MNNAGVLLDNDGDITSEQGASAFRMDVAVVRDSAVTNALGPFQLCQRLIPLMIAGGYGRVVNVSSGGGQLSEMRGGWPGYRVSKAALNVMTRIFAAETAGMGILVNSVCPGRGRTDRGGPEADLSVEEGVETILWLATLPDDDPSGGFFRSFASLAW